MDFLRGAVTQAAPLLVKLDNGASEVDATRLESYTAPTVGHRVICAMVGTGLVIFGREV